MSITQLALSLAAVLALAATARLLRLGESHIGGAASARHFAETLLAGFEARGALVSGDGNAAIVAGNGAVAVLKRHGAHVAARRLLTPLAIRAAVEGVRIETGERLFGAVMLHGVVEDEVRSLAALCDA